MTDHVLCCVQGRGIRNTEASLLDGSLPIRSPQTSVSCNVIMIAKRPAISWSSTRFLGSAKSFLGSRQIRVRSKHVQTCPYFPTSPQRPAEFLSRCSHSLKMSTMWGTKTFGWTLRGEKKRSLSHDDMIILVMFRVGIVWRSLSTSCDLSPSLSALLLLH